MRITHIPTGIVVSCQDEKSQHKNRAKGMKIMRARLLEKKQEEQRSEIAATRKLMVGSGDRSERIRTYNFPQGRLTDHRINLTLYQLDRVMEGELDEVVEAFDYALSGGSAEGDWREQDGKPHSLSNAQCRAACDVTDLRGVMVEAPVSRPGVGIERLNSMQKCFSAMSWESRSEQLYQRLRCAFKRQIDNCDASGNVAAPARARACRLYYRPKGVLVPRLFRHPRCPHPAA